MALEHGEVRHDADEGAADLLARRPGALARDLGAPEIRGGPLDAEEVLVAVGERREGVPLPALADDLGDGAAGGVAVLLLAFERRLHHLHGHVRGKPLEGRPRRRVVPEPEDRAGQLGHGERREDEAQRPSEDAGEGPRRGRRGGSERPPRPFLRGRARRRPGGLPGTRLSGAGGDPGAPRPEPGRLLRGGPGRPPRPFARRLALSRRPRVRAAPAGPGPPFRRGGAASEGGGGPSLAGACGEAVLAGHQPGAHRVRPPHRGDLRGARALSPGEGLRGSPRGLGPLYPSAFPAHGSPSSPARPRARRLNSSSRLRAAISSGFVLKRS